MSFSNAQQLLHVSSHGHGTDAHPDTDPWLPQSYCSAPYKHGNHKGIPLTETDNAELTAG